MNALIKATAKRYRYTGKERDEESGLYYHGARYYIPWLCRWSASDPLESEYAGMSPYNYSFNNPVVYNDPSGNNPEGGNSGVWVETIKDGGRSYLWVEGAKNFDDASISPKLDGVELTGNAYERMMFTDENGTTALFSDGTYSLPEDRSKDNSFDKHIATIRAAKDGAVLTFNAYAEYRYKMIISNNIEKGIKVDNFGTVRNSPRKYKDVFSRGAVGGSSWIDQGGASARGKFTTRTSAWQNSFDNFITPNATRWKSTAQVLESGFGLVFDFISLYGVAQGGSPLSILPLDPSLFVTRNKADISFFKTDVGSNIYGTEYSGSGLNFEDMKSTIKREQNNPKNTLQGFYQQLSFVYTSDKQLDLLKRGELNIENLYFSSPRKNATNATLVWKNNNNYSIIKTYGIGN